MKLELTRIEAFDVAFVLNQAAREMKDEIEGKGISKPTPTIDNKILVLEQVANALKAGMVIIIEREKQ